MRQCKEDNSSQWKVRYAKRCGHHVSQLELGHPFRPVKGAVIKNVTDWGGRV